MEFQAFSWFVDDGSDSVDDDPETMEMTVHIFGKTKAGQSVSVHVKDFHPSFCIKFPKDVVANEKTYDEFTDLLKTKLTNWDTNEEGKLEMTADYGDHLLEDEDKVIYRKNMWGFTNGEQQPFFNLVFKSIKAYSKALALLRACHRNTMSMQEMQSFYHEWNSFVDKRDKRDREAQNEFIKKVSLERDVRESCLRWICKLGDKNLSFRYAQGKLFEVIDPILRFAHLKDLKMAGWVRLSKFSEPPEKSSTCELEYTCSYEDLEPVIKDDICPTIKEMAFDIEAYSYDDMFPDPADPRNYAYQIGITLKHYADPKPQRILLHCKTPKELRGKNSGECGNIPDTRVINFETESELLKAFANIIVREDPDVIYGYNSDMFDWSYLMKRAEVTGSMGTFARLSRFKHYVCKVEAKSFQSSAYGDNKYLRVDIPGRMNVDLMIWIQRNMPPDRYPSYALDAVAEKEIDENKRDVDAKDIFAAFRSGDSVECTRIGDYCCQDTVLVQNLVNKLDVLTQMSEMANITDTPPMYLLQKGQQIKVFSQICKKARLKGFLVPLADDRDDSTFKGAIVLEPITGMYRSPVSVLDFASLYPSIQVAYNICYSTVVLDEKTYSPSELDKLGVKYDLIEWEDEILQYRNRLKGTVKDFGGLEDAKKFAPRKEILENLERNDDTDTVTWRWTKKKYSYTFVQNDDSIIPDLQIELKKSRKAVRRMMGPIEKSDNPDDQLRWRVLNGRQLAIKVSMNSIYGFTSAFMLNMMALSAAVTAKGRQMIEQTRDFMEKDFNKIALVEKWTQEDVEAYYTKDGKEISVKEGDLPPPKSIRKFPTAVAGKTWTDRDLSIQVVAGDTDSVFCHFPGSTIGEAISLCHKAEVLLTDTIFNRHPIEMEYEKTYMPIVIQKKKNYVGVKYGNDDQYLDVDYKGIAVKRRNYCPLVKEIFWKVIYPTLGVEAYKVMVDGKEKTKYRKVDWNYMEGPDRAVAALRESLRRLETRQVDWDDLLISKSLKSNYKSENQPHVQLVKRIKERDPGSEPKSGQRFNMVIVNDDSRDSELCARSEDPKYAKKMGLLPDFIFYLDQQIRKPLTTFLSIIGKAKETQEVFDKVQNSLFEQLRRERSAKELATRKAFLSGQAPTKVPPLKAPKKPTISKAEKLKTMKSTCTDMSSIFMSKPSNGR